MFIKSKIKTPFLRGVILAVLLTLIGASPAAAVKSVCLVAKEFVDPNGVTMWGYGEIEIVGPNNTFFAQCRAADQSTVTATVPGPRIEVPVGDWLRVHLRNFLPVPTSFGINGMVKRNVNAGNDRMVPQYDLPVGNPLRRIISLDDEAAANGGEQFYRFRRGEVSASDDQPGTFLYGSVSHMQVQRQMGLYGAVTQDEATGEAYPGVLYDAEEVLIYSEVDPALHALVDADTGPGDSLVDGWIGAPGGTPSGYTSTIDYNPQYFLLNGEHRPYAASGGAGVLDIGGAAEAGDNVLLRMLNAGLRTVVPNILGARCSVVAEDGNLYPYPRDQYSVGIWAGSTRDCVVTPTAEGTYPIVEGRTTGLNANGGQLAFLNVGPVGAGGNVPPVANDGSADPIMVVGEDDPTTLSPFSVLANDTDADSGPVSPLTAILSSPTSNGTLVLNPSGTFTYEPNLNFNGADSFTYRAFDGADFSAIATVDITVNPVGDVPAAVDDSLVVAQNDPGVTIHPTVLANDFDPDTGLPPTAASLVATTSNGTLVLNPDGTFTYTPIPGYWGPDSFTYTADNGTGFSTDATVNITVTPVNGAPVAVDDSLVVAQDSGPTAHASVLGNDSDPDNGPDPLTVVLVTDTANGTLALNLDGTYSYEPNPGQSDPDSFTYRASDGADVSNIATVSITVTAAPVAPVVAVDDPGYSVGEDGVLSGSTILVNDTGAITSVSLVSPSINGPTFNGTGTIALNTVTGTFTYTPNPDFFGVDGFTYQVSDGVNLSNVATVTITVNSVNDAPVAVNDPAIVDDPDYTVAEDSGTTIVFASVLANDTDAEGDALTAVLGVGNNGGGLFSLLPDGTFVYDSGPDFFGTDIFTYQAFDGAALSNVATVSITVTPVPDLPVAVNDGSLGVPFLTVAEDSGETQVGVSVLANDNDPDNGPAPLTASLVTPTSNGAVVLNPDGTFNYTPNGDYFGPDSFTYTASSGLRVSAPATVFITVTSVNDDPVALDDGGYFARERTANNQRRNAWILVDSVTTNDSDLEDGPFPPGTTITLSSNTTDQGGQVVLRTRRGARVIRYRAPVDNIPNGTTSVDTFTYTVTDSEGAVSNPATVSVTVVGGNWAAFRAAGGFTENQPNQTGSP